MYIVTIIIMIVDDIDDDLKPTCRNIILRRAMVMPAKKMV